MRILSCKKLAGWILDGWVGGWVDGKASLRIAYSNQKYSKQKMFETKKCFGLHCHITFCCVGDATTLKFILLGGICLRSMLERSILKGQGPSAAWRTPNRPVLGRPIFKLALFPFSNLTLTPPSTRHPPHLASGIPRARYYPSIDVGAFVFSDSALLIWSSDPAQS